MYEYLHTLHIFEYKFSSRLSFALLFLNYSLHHLILYYFISIIYFSREPFLSYLTKLLHLIFFTHNPLFFTFLLFFSIIIWICTCCQYFLLKKSCMIYGMWSRKELLYRHIMAVSEIKEKEKGKVYLRRKWLKLPKSWEEKWTKKLVKLKWPQIESAQSRLLWDLL